MFNGASVDAASINAIATAAHGYTPADLHSLVCLANTMADNGVVHSVPALSELADTTPTVTLAHLRYALAHTRASVMRSVVLEVPHTRWSDIVGYDDVKTRLQQTVEWPLRHAAVFARLNVRPASGLLLYGPPGCSKTLLVRALATESGLNFMAVKGPELFSSYVGESERAVRQLFARARQAAPSVVFFDELDALAQHRGGDNKTQSAVGDRVVTQLLTELDGLEPLHGVIVVAATNRPDTIDRALLRPGRLDTTVYVPLPDAATRRAIVEHTIDTMPVDSSVNLAMLVHETEGYSGAELVGVCREAALAAMRDNIECTSVTHTDFVGALRTVRPGTDRQVVEMCERFERGAGV